MDGAQVASSSSVEVSADNDVGGGAEATGMSGSGVLTRVPWLEENRCWRDDVFDQREQTVLAQIGIRSRLIGGNSLACFRAPYRLDPKLCYYRIMKAG